jgi:cytochrome P450
MPERFVDDPAEYGAVQNFSFVPFGTGRRGCPGAGFASLSMELALVSLLYHFDWELWNGVMTHKYRGCIIVLSINKSVEPNEDQKVLTSGFDQGFTVNTSKRVFRGI